MHSEIVRDAFGEYLEIAEDELSALLHAGPVTFRVLEDVWTEDYTVRTIKRAEIIAR